MKWKDKVFKEIIGEIAKDEDWIDIKSKLESGRNDVGVHVAVFSEPYLTLVLEGKKTMESRFSVNRISPFGRIHEGDIVLLKKAGGPIVGMFLTGEIYFYSRLTLKKLEEIARNYSNKICSYVDTDFWKLREDSKYATLIEIKKTRETKPIQITKSDRTAWSIVQNKVLSLFDKHE